MPQHRAALRGIEQARHGTQFDHGRHTGQQFGQVFNQQANGVAGPHAVHPRRTYL